MDFLSVLLIFLLFLISAIGAYFIGYKFGAFNREKSWQLKLPEYRKQAIEKSRSVLKGQFSEHFAPFLPGFGFNPSDCKFLGKPVDFIVFNGLSKEDIEKVVFVEVKSGKSKLNSTQKKLKKAIEDKRVEWKEYYVPEEDNLTL